MPFVPDDFLPPTSFHAENFRLAVLSPAFAQQDFEAVRASASAIRHVFGLQNGWPDEHMGFEQNLADLVRHEDEFERRVAFAYALLDPADASYLGCFYVKPIKSKRNNDLRKQQFQAQAFVWLSVSATALSVDHVVPVLARWLSDCWPFGAVAFPGRIQGWPEWEALAQEGPNSAHGVP